MANDLQSQDPPKCKKCGGEKRTYLCGVKSGNPYKQSFCLACQYARLFPNRTSAEGHKARIEGQPIVLECPREFRKRKRLPLSFTKHPSRREWDRNNSEKRRAQKSVEHALNTGKIVKKPCERCGAIKVHGHHEDYSKPLDVVWLCPKHHLARHRDTS